MQVLASEGHFKVSYQARTTYPESLKVLSWTEEGRRKWWGRRSKRRDV